MGGGLLRVDKYHTRKGCQVERAFNAFLIVERASRFLSLTHDGDIFRFEQPEFLLLFFHDATIKPYLLFCRVN